MKKTFKKFLTPCTRNKGQKVNTLRIVKETKLWVHISMYVSIYHLGVVEGSPKKFEFKGRLHV